MKSFSFKKSVGMLFVTFSFAAGVHATNQIVNVPSAGQLSSVLSSTDVDSLTITGYLNSSDFSYMRYDLSRLVYLDISQTTVNDNAIPSYALESKTTLNEVILPPSIVSIDDYAFYNCVSLTKITFPEGLQSIGYATFGDCTSLTGELLLPSTLTSIGNYAFYNTSYASCKISAVTPPALSSSNALGNISLVFVPQEAGENYKNASYWSQKIIIAGEPETVNVTLTQAGTLGVKILEQVESMYDVNKLAVSGPLNDADWSQIKNNLPNLISIDLSATTATAIPNDQFENKSALWEIKLPNTLLSIGNYAFYACKFQSIEIPATVTTIGEFAFGYVPLKEIILPASLTSLEGYAFYQCQNLESVTIPESITLIKQATFNSCSNLKEVVIPNTITQIESEAFSYCTSLSSIQLPNSLTSLGNRVFYNCPLDSVTLPAKLSSIGYGSLNSSTIKKITCLQPTPPVLTNDPFYYYSGTSVDKSTCELVIPFWAETSYKLANIWGQFQNVSTWNAEIDYLPVSGTLDLSDNVRPLGNPTVEIMAQGNLSVWGNAPFNTHDFILRHQLRNYIATTSSSYCPYYSQLISECNAITAQNVKIDMSVYGNHWYYITFPFDVAMYNVGIDEGVSYVFRYYDGNSRATIGAGNSWKNVELSDTLRAGQGYIFQCSKNAGHLVLPATDQSKSRLFTPVAQAVALNEYPSENAADRNWNLAGNPFPSYYDIRCMDYTAPITYWNDYYGSYEALSPVDDIFLLQPMQAFFVQKPNDLESITFTPEGRQTSSTAQLRSSKLRLGASSSRTIINLTLSNEHFADKSRIVLNSNAQLAYEIECDASKFMSIAPEVPQLYSIDRSDVHYAINERPLDDGVIPLGFYTGSAGEYAIALQEPVEGIEILLKDKQLNTTFNLSDGEYAFNAETGAFDNRFELQIKATEVVTALPNSEKQAINVSAAKGVIIIENATEPITVYTINGVEVVKSDATSIKTILPLPQGIYVVKTGEKAFKTVVF